MLTLHQALQTAVLWEQGFHSETCAPLRSVILHLKTQLKCHMLTEAFFLCLKKPQVLWRVLYKSKLWFLLLLYNIIIGYYCNRLSSSYLLPMCLYIYKAAFPYARHQRVLPRWSCTSSPSNIVGAPPSNIKLINNLKIHLKNEKSVYTNQDMKYLSPVLGDFQEALVSFGC